MNGISTAPGLLSDEEIRAYCKPEDARYDPMITPFVGHQVRDVHDPDEDTGRRKVISYGLSSCGYDIRLGQDFRIFSDTRGCAIIDPHEFPKEALVQTRPEPWGAADVVYVPPRSYALGVSYEKFSMPPNVLGICTGKSTWARCGLIVNVTPLEPGWEGHLTIEIANPAPRAVRVYLMQGIAQVLFFRATTDPMVTYDERKGKYQDQGDAVVPAKA